MHLDQRRTDTFHEHLFTNSSPRSLYFAIHRLTPSMMSGYYSSGNEGLLSDEEAQRLFYQTQADYPSSGGQPTASGYQQQQWETGLYPGMASSSSQGQPQAFAPPCQYVSWPTTAFPNLEPMGSTRGQYPSIAPPLVPSTPYTSDPWPNAPWPSLHPDDVEASSDTSRSTSPNPADLSNFGILLPDGRSWRCAYSGCTSNARFTRGCDLRKHYRRHTKSLFCRHEDCPQSKEGGFSSKKDLVRFRRLLHSPQCFRKKLRGPQLSWYFLSA